MRDYIFAKDLVTAACKGLASPQCHIMYVLQRRGKGEWGREFMREREELGIEGLEKTMHVYLAL